MAILESLKNTQNRGFLGNLYFSSNGGMLVGEGDLGRADFGYTEKQNIFNEISDTDSVKKTFSFFKLFLSSLYLDSLCFQNKVEK